VTEVEQLRERVRELEAELLTERARGDRWMASVHTADCEGSAAEQRAQAAERNRSEANAEAVEAIHDLGAKLEAAEAERDEAQRVARDHHIEKGCLTCMVLESDRLAAEERERKLREALQSDVAAITARMDEYVQAGRISKADALHEVIETLRRTLAVQPTERAPEPREACGLFVPCHKDGTCVLLCNLCGLPAEAHGTGEGE